MKFDAALCLEGGAMRGVFSDGVLDAFIDNDICFSSVYGVSSGAKAMQYYPTRQRGYAYKGDLESSQTESMFNLANIMLGKPVIDFSYYINEIRNKKYPLDYASLTQSETNLYIGATNIETGLIEWFKKDDQSFLEALCASCSLPVLQPEVNIRGKLYLDGGCAEPIPYVSAQKDGHKKIVVIATREYGYRGEENHAYDFAFDMKYSRYPNFLNLVKNMTKIENEYFTRLEELEACGEILVIRPSVKPDCDRLERDKEKLERLYLDGYNEGKKAILKFIDYFK